jgi:hypothetical protein
MTVQLRRYRLEPELAADFISWFAGVSTVRAEFGFRVEFAFHDPETNEFIWAVSCDGDFDAVEAEYLASPQRAKLFEGIPKWATIERVSKVDVVVPTRA